MDRPISLQAAINVIDNYMDKSTELHYLPTSDGIKKLISVLPSAQSEIIRCRECKWQKDQSGSTAWLPCRALVTPPDFYCGRAERRTDE